MKIVFGSALLLLLGITFLLNETVANAEDWETWSSNTVAERFRRSAQFQVGEEATAKPAVVDETPRLRWTNPSAGTVHGLDYLVLDQGIPVAYCSVYQWFSPLTNATVDLTSLSAQPIQLKMGSKLAWDSHEPGVSFTPVGQPLLATLPAGQRLAAMRRLTQQFSVILNRDSRASSDNVVRTLRLLERPIYRYEKPAAPIVDGGLFAFVEGTDPEVLLCLQFRATDKGELQLEYAFARTNNSELVAKLGKQTVWTVPEVGEAWVDKSRPYYLLSLDDLKPAPEEFTAADKPSGE